jgi:sulfoxide reductase heme-binding subunit YedZ
VSVGYVAVQWNRHKRAYDALLLAGVLAYLGTFLLVGRLAFRGAHAVSGPILLMRALGTCALLMLHIVLCIGPLNPRFAPLLYNRRHFGVATFLAGLLHAALAVGFYHGFGALHPLASLLATNTNYGSLRAFPYQILGLGALVVLLLMAVTSHDFWLKNLGQRTWKNLHMLVYAAYGLLVMHVGLGALQSQRSPWLALLLLVGVLTVAALHAFAGWREHLRDQAQEARPAGEERWLDVAGVDEIPESRGRTVTLRGGERIAVFRHDGCISAITNVCAHQGGPLGEGKIIDGCVTCPWHGWQYRPADGCAPPPFTEKIATYRVRVAGRRVLVDPSPLAPGTPVEPARFQERADG